MYLPEKGYKRVIVVTFYLLLAAVLTFVFFKYLLRCVLPFAAAFVIAYSLRPVIAFMCEKLKMPRFVSVLLCATVIIGAVLLLIYLIFSRALSEAAGLMKYLSAENIMLAVSNISESVKGVLIRVFPSMTEEIQVRINSLAENLDAVAISAAERVLPYIGRGAVNLVSFLPQALLFAGVTVLSLFYFGCDYERITSFLKLQLSDKASEFVFALKEQFFVTVINVVRAYGILLLMTFLELLVGFVIMGISYATLLAALIALVDILPIFGTGTVLIPWGVIELLTGNFKTGLCILALYVIIVTVRQIAEPKILGVSVGLHPLVTLMAMYFGLKIAGFAGLFIFPFVVIIVKNLNEKGVIRLYKNPVNDGGGESAEKTVRRLAKRKKQKEKSKNITETGGQKLG